MKKLFLLLLFIIAVPSLAACGFIGEDEIPEEYKRVFEGCNGQGDYIIVDGICYPMNDLVSENIHISGTEVRAEYNNAIELMDDFVADLSGSSGLAVVDRDMYERQSASPQAAMADEEPDDDETENVIVKLTDDGFFEEVSFTDDFGFSVEVTANPLVLEVYGDFTVVIFEVNHGYQDPNQTFDQKVWDSFYSGGIYLIHNDTGKLFATKDVVFNEDSWIDYEYYNREVVVMATLNEPIKEIIIKDILDEDGNPVLDENGNPTFEEIEKELLDNNGNPIIFTEGPLMTEILEVPLVEYFEVEILDEDGNPVLDENGNPTYELVEEPVLDENGNPKFETQEVPVLDENGNPVMMETFEVRFNVEEQIEVQHTNYWADITDSPLTPLAERFMQKVMEEYYNWNYYRINEYVLHDYNFTYSNEYIYYNQYVHDSSTNTQSRTIKKMYFDDVTSEIVIEDYMDLELAGFNNCEIFVEPVNGSIICNPWDGNIKLFSTTHGLKTVEDSEHLEAIVLPNGELYFMDNNSTWVEELGYNTVELHTINLDGTLNSNYVELGERAQTCIGDCNQYFNISFTDIDEDEDEWRTSRHMSFNFPTGSKYVESADATIITIGEFDSERPVCEDANGCWYNQETQVVDEDGNIIARNWHSGTYYPDDTPPSYVKTYLFDSNAEVINRREYSTEIKICDSEIGCTDDLHLKDDSIGNDGLWIWGRFLIEDGDQFIDNIYMDEDNTAVYEFTKTTNGEVCDQEDSCVRWIEEYYYQDDELIAQTSREMTIAEGETIPLFIEYNTSSDSTITYRTETCNNAGCSELVEINDEFSFWKYYENGEVMLASIDYADTDKEIVTVNVEEREICTEVNGCYFGDVVYTINDAEGNPLYVFETNLHVEYGYKAAYNVTISIDECTINYQNVWSEEDKLCNETTCTEWFNVYKGDWNTHIGNGDKIYNEGETIIDTIILPNDATMTESFENICQDLNGCYMSTENFVFLLEDGTDVTYTYDGWHENIDVFFEYGDALPLDNQFYVEYELTNLEYATYRMDSWEFREGLRNMVRLDENLYLLEKNSWSEGEYNYILSFDDATSRYKVQYTNMTTVLEITVFNDSFIAVNEDKTAILQYTFNAALSDENMYYFDEVNLTEGLDLHGVNDLIVDYDGSIYFSGIDSFLNPITGSIDEFGVISVDTEYVEPVIVRVRPIN